MKDRMVGATSTTTKARCLPFDLIRFVRLAGGVQVRSGRPYRVDGGHGGCRVVGLHWGVGIVFVSSRELFHGHGMVRGEYVSLVMLEYVCANCMHLCLTYNSSSGSSRGSRSLRLTRRVRWLVVLVGIDLQCFPLYQGPKSYR